MKKYKCLTQQEFSNGEYKLVPICHEDRYKIMKWRNEQIYHLRQKEPLTTEQQDAYFEYVVAKLFDQEQPNQVLFSFLRNEELIGYGGLVHINWNDKNAEVSFLTKDPNQLELWSMYLEVLKSVAFEDLQLNKIYTYAYDIRPELYALLESANFILEGNFSNHVNNGIETCDVRIHSCYNSNREFWRRQATLGDAKQLYQWANDADVRAQSLQSDAITWTSHIEWFHQKLQHPTSRLYIYYLKEQPLGNLRLDLFDGKYKISYLIDAEFRGKGFGRRIIEDSINISNKTLVADVKTNNNASNKVFERLSFQLLGTQNDINTWVYAR
jgi:RimJ/RimL family protein N-acetyltransferase